MEAKYTYTSAITGKLEYFQNGSLKIVNGSVNKTFTKDELTDLAKDYKGANRIHKPIALLFWIDCKNGNYSNWKKD